MDTYGSCAVEGPVGYGNGGGNTGGGSGNDGQDNEPVNPLGAHLSNDDLKVLSMVMYYEYKGYAPRDEIPYYIVYMKFWVFFNLINTRILKINNVDPVYSGNKVVGVWNAYVAIAGHESPLKPAMAQWNNAGQYGWDPDNYVGQYDALLKNANSVLGSTSSEKEVLAKFLEEATKAESLWYRYGSGSRVDPTQGSVSFVDHPANDPVMPYWNVVSELFDFEPGVPMYTRFDDLK